MRHVADSFSFSIAANGESALAASTVRVSVIDGASAVLHIGSNGVTAIPYTNMGLAGGGATALTIEFSGAVTGAFTSLNLGYFDVGP